jgi:hypothetical protein
VIAQTLYENGRNKKIINSVLWLKIMAWNFKINRVKYFLLGILYVAAVAVSLLYARTQQ